MVLRSSISLCQGVPIPVVPVLVEDGSQGTFPCRCCLLSEPPMQHKTQYQNEEPDSACGKGIANVTDRHCCSPESLTSQHREWAAVAHSMGRQHPPLAFREQAFGRCWPCCILRTPGRDPPGALGCIPRLAGSVGGTPGAVCPALPVGSGLPTEMLPRYAQVMRNPTSSC